MPRFVLLYHDCPLTYVRPSHWDFMLESGNLLRTWVLEQLPRNWQAARTRTSIAYPNCPVLSENNTVAAIPLSEHRRDYLELEGSLTGDRGTVMRVATGTYRSEHQTQSDWRVVLTGDDLASSIRLSQLNGEDDRWTLSCS